MPAPKNDPVVASSSVDPTEYPEGTHPARPASEVEHAADKLKYRDLKDKPDKTTVAQEQVLPEDEG